jgi:Ca2+-binding RTX toxin-like protein
MAAESYIDGINRQDPNAVIAALVAGNNAPGSNPNLPLGATRFVNLANVTNASQITGSAQAFVSRFQIVDHHANDSTGFSATLMQERGTNNFTLSFRSLEYQDQAQGGDWERDGQGGAAGEIAGAGFALGQLVSMERYYQELKNSGALPAGAVLNVTGYSLGGHLATVFTELHSNEINHTYIFNGAGIGQVGGVTPVLTEEIRIKQLIDAMDAKFMEFDPTGNLTRSGSPANVQTLSWYQPAVIEVAGQFQTTGTASLPGGVTRTDGAFAKITQLFGHATSGVDTEVVANSGVHGPVTPILIEGQPLLEGLNQQRELQYGNSHSITLLVDSLALQELFQKIDPNLTQAQMETIFKASSDAKAGIFGQTHVAEGDTLELALDALRRVFLGNQVPPTDFNDNAGGFGDVGFRNQFYTHLQEVRAALNGQTYQVASLVGQPIETIKGNALLPGATGTAFRYALKELNPIAVIGANYDQFHNPGDLDLFNPETGNGALTREYLADRASFLGRKLELNTNNGPGLVDQLNGIHWKDYASDYEINPGAIFSRTPREYLFGGHGDDMLTGNIFADRLYGGDGEDTIEGNASNDYIEGNDGNDVLLSGGSGKDIIFGGQGDDTLDGGSGNDILDGGLDNDILKGGTGLDTYFYRTGQGLDRIVDADKVGAIIFDNQTLVGGIRRQGAPADTYLSPDGQFTFVKSGANLVINTTLTIENFDFQTGALGINLADAGNLADSAGPVIDYNNGQPTLRYDGDATANHPTFTAAANHDVYGYGGNDVLSLSTSSALFNHQLFGGDDDDELSGGAGQDRLFGDDGLDVLFGGAGDDVLDGGAGDDLLNGGVGQDVLSGGLDNDSLRGDSGDDVLVGGEGADLMFGDDRQMDPTRPIGKDYLDGGAGDDWLFGGLGDDVLVGGTVRQHSCLTPFSMERMAA